MSRAPVPEAALSLDAVSELHASLMAEAMSQATDRRSGRDKANHAAATEKARRAERERERQDRNRRAWAEHLFCLAGSARERAERLEQEALSILDPKSASEAGGAS